MADGGGGKKGTDPVFPLILEKRVMYDNEGLHFQLGGNVQGTHSFTAARLETDHSVSWMGFQVSVHHFHLSGADRSCKCPSVGS